MILSAISNSHPLWQYTLGLVCECGEPRERHLTFEGIEGERCLGTFEKQRCPCQQFRPWLKTCTRRPMKCLNCGQNSLAHGENCKCGHSLKEDHSTAIYCTRCMGVVSTDCIICKKQCKSGGFCQDWQPAPCKYIVGNYYAIQPKRGEKAVCVCGCLEKEHRETYDLETDDADTRCKNSFYTGTHPCTCQKYRPAYLRVTSVMAEEEWLRIEREKYRIEGYVNSWQPRLEAEAHREAQNSYAHLQETIKGIYGGLPKMWRIGIEYVGEKEGEEK